MVSHHVGLWLFRKNQRALKLSTLVLLDTLVKNYSSGLNTQMLGPVLSELPPLVSESGRPHCG
jgi:hypothetical protein